jgi:transposase
MMMSLSEAVRALRGKETQQAFATRLGISIATQQNWEGQRAKRYAAMGRHRQRDASGHMQVLFKFLREASRAGNWDIYDILLAELRSRMGTRVPDWQIESLAIEPQNEFEAKCVDRFLEYLRTPAGQNPNNLVLDILRQAVPLTNHAPAPSRRISQVFQRHPKLNAHKRQADKGDVLRAPARAPVLGGYLLGVQITKSTPPVSVNLIFTPAKARSTACSVAV